MVKQLQYLVAVLFLVFCSSHAQAASLTHAYTQGYLTKTDGTPVTSTASMTFSLYSVASGGTPLWSEVHGSVPVTAGVYGAELGRITPLNLTFDRSYYIGTKVGSDPEIAPRQILSPGLAVARVGITHSTGTAISGVTSDLAYAASRLTIAGSDIVQSGSGVGALLATNTATSGAVRISVATDSATISGEVATLNFHIVSGSEISASDISVSRSTIVDDNGVPIYGATAGILGLSFPLPGLKTLQVSLTGTGGGSVNSAPSGIACLTGTCSASFSEGGVVTLKAAPNSDSLFSGWSGACVNPTGDCAVTLSTAQSVSAGFTAVLPFKVSGGSTYSLAQSAYSAAASGGTVLGRDKVVVQNLVADQAKTVTLKGGYDTSFSAKTGATVLDGVLQIRSGKVICSGVKVR